MEIFALKYFSGKIRYFFPLLTGTVMYRFLIMDLKMMLYNSSNFLLKMILFINRIMGFRQSILTEWHIVCLRNVF